MIALIPAIYYRLSIVGFWLGYSGSLKEDYQAIRPDSQTKQKLTMVTSTIFLTDCLLLVRDIDNIPDIQFAGTDGDGVFADG